MSEAPKARLGPVTALLLVAGNMIGSGAYMLPATLGVYGGVSLVSWIIGAGGALLLALVFAFLGVLRPRADGAVGYATEGLGGALGHLGWFTYWLSDWIGVSAIAVAITGYCAYFFPLLKAPLPGLAATVAAIWAMVGLNLIGPRLVGRFGATTLLIGLAPILVATVIGAFAFDLQLFAASWNVSGMPASSAILAGVAPVFWAYLGLESANVVVGVIDNPKRNLPIAAVGGVTLATVIYVAASAALMGLMPAKALAGSTAPYADAILGVAGPLAGAVVAACALLKATGTLGGWVLLTAETGRSGAAAGFLPRRLSEVAPGGKLTRDLIVAGALISLAAAGSVSPTLSRQFSLLINVTVILSMILYLLCALALLRLAGEVEGRGRRLLAKVAAVLAAGFSAWVIVIADASLRGPTLAVVVLGFCLYLFARRRQPAGG